MKCSPGSQPSSNRLGVSANVSQLITVDNDFLTERAGRITDVLLRQVEDGLRLVLNL